MTKPTATILREMADHIETYGFHKRGYFPGQSDGDDYTTTQDWDAVYPDWRQRPCCALGAYMATQSAPDALNVDPIAEALGLRGAFDFPAWNDAKDMTQEKVINALRTAADNLNKEQK